MTPAQIEITKAVATLSKLLPAETRFVLTAVFPNGEFLSAQNIEPREAIRFAETLIGDVARKVLKENRSLEDIGNGVLRQLPEGAGIVLVHVQPDGRRESVRITGNMPDDKTLAVLEDAAERFADQMDTQDEQRN